MKILMLISSLEVGGAETHLFELARALAAGGNSVTVASGGGRLVAPLEECGIECVRLPLASRSPLSVFRCRIALRRLIRKRSFDIVHAHSRIAAFCGEWAARKEKKCFVTTVHARFRINRFLRRYSKWGYKSIAVSEDLAGYLSDGYSVPFDNVSVILNGIDTDKFYPKDKAEKSVAFVSRLDADSSDAAYALCCVAKPLSLRYPGIRIKIYGGGSEYKKLLAISEAVNGDIGYDCVLLLGGGKKISNEISGTGVFVGVSRSALEAMSAGVPTVLAGNEGMLGALCRDNIEEAARSNFCGRGAARINKDRLYADICRLLDLDGEARKELSTFLRSYVLNNHSIEKMAKQTLDFYCRALSSVSFDMGEVCLCGYYGYRNVGDEVLLELAKKRAGEKVVALTHSKRRTSYAVGIPCYSRFDPFSVVSAVLGSKKLVFGGGTLFQDRTSLRSLIYYLLLAETALFFGKRVELWGNGICIPRHRITRAWLSRILRRTAYVGVRDKPSYDAAIALGARERRTHLEGDLALSVDASHCDGSFRTRALTRDARRYALFSVSGATSREDYDRAVDKALRVKERGVTPIVVAMYPAKDKDISLRFARESGGRYTEGLSATELISLLKGAELCLSARLHLLIFSRLAGTRFDRIGDDPKLVAFCKEKEI